MTAYIAIDGVDEEEIPDEIAYYMTGRAVDALQGLVHSEDEPPKAFRRQLAEERGVSPDDIQFSAGLCTDDTPMETEERYDADVFDHIDCPVCESCSWTEIRFEGVFCDECNCKATLEPTNGDRGFVAEFNRGHIWAHVELEGISDDDGYIGHTKYLGPHETDEGDETYVKTGPVLWDRDRVIA